MNQSALWEGIKDGLRVAVFAAIGAALTALLSAAANIQDPTLQLVVVAVLTAAGKAWDRKVHEDATDARTGLLPF